MSISSPRAKRHRVPVEEGARASENCAPKNCAPELRAAHASSSMSPCRLPIPVRDVEDRRRRRCTIAPTARTAPASGRRPSGCAHTRAARRPRRAATPRGRRRGREVERARRGVVVAVRRHLEPRCARRFSGWASRRGDVPCARRLGAEDARGEREAAGARERLRRVHAVGVRVAEDEPRRRLVRRAEPVDRQVLLVVARREQRRLGLAHALEDERLALLGAVRADGDRELRRVRVGDVAVRSPRIGSSARAR